jgi:hypothetical protein
MAHDRAFEVPESAEVTFISPWTYCRAGKLRILFWLIPVG